MYQDQNSHSPEGRRFYFRPAGGAPSTLSFVIARNLRRLRSERGYSIEALASALGVDVQTLRAIESGGGEPTLEFAWEIARGLDIPFAALIADHAPRGVVMTRRQSSWVIVSEDLGLTTRALFPFDKDRPVEFYELRLAPNHRETSAAHAPGTVEMLLVSKGQLEITVGREPAKILECGDSILIPGDLPHIYHNPATTPATIYLVMHYRHTKREPTLDESFIAS